jgi:hypothetical protein
MNLNILSLLQWFAKEEQKDLKNANKNPQISGKDVSNLLLNVDKAVFTAGSVGKSS